MWDAKSGRYNQVLEGNEPDLFNPDFAGGCICDEAGCFANMIPGLTDSSGITLMSYDVL